PTVAARRTCGSARVQLALAQRRVRLDRRGGIGVVGPRHHRQRILRGDRHDRVVPDLVQRDVHRDAIAGDAAGWIYRATHHELGLVAIDPDGAPAGTAGHGD